MYSMDWIQMIHGLTVKQVTSKGSPEIPGQACCKKESEQQASFKIKDYLIFAPFDSVAQI